MKNLIYISILFFFGFNCSDFKCGLKDGRYKAVYDDEFADRPQFEFEVDGQILTQINSDSKNKFRIEKLGKNSFRLKSFEKQMDSLTEFQKALTSHGQPYYEITDCKGDTINFTMRVNLHVISHSGKFIRAN